MNAFFTDQVGKKSIAMFITDTLNEEEDAQIEADKHKKSFQDQLSDKARYLQNKAQNLVHKMPEHFQIKKQTKESADPLAGL